MSFIDTGAVPSGKVDVFPVPATANPNNYAPAADWNEICQDLLDLRTALIDGGFLGLQRTTTTPTLPSGGSADFLWTFGPSGGSPVQLRYTSAGVSYSLAEGSVLTPTFLLGTGAGPNATASVSGSDKTGTVTVNTSVLDTPAASANIITLTFGHAYLIQPTVIMMPANDAAWALAYGTARLRSGDTSQSQFTIRSGTTPLPATTAATYLFSYIVRA